MNIKRWIWASLAAFATLMILDHPLHNMILAPYYSAMQQLWRPNMMSLMWLMLLSYLLMSFLFAFIYAKGYEGKGLMEGLRFGLIVGCFYQIPHIISQYVVYPIPLGLTIGWVAGGIVEFLVCGLVVGAIYKK